MNAAPLAAATVPARAAAPEALRRHVGALLAGCRPGHALPGAFFTDETLYGADIEYIFGRHWLFVASEPEIPESGDYRTLQIGPWPIFLLRRDDGSIAAFHNTCRHRGSRILQQDSGIAGATLQCPYHRWSYDLDGRVIGCGATGERPAEQRALAPLHVRTLAGLIFVCLADEPPQDFEDMARRMAPYLAPHGLAYAKVAKQVDILEEGNWKLTIENNRECFHCAGHPELLCSLFEFFGDIDVARLTAAEREAYARYQSAREETEAIWRRAQLPWQPIEELCGRPTAFRTERLVLDGAGESMTADTRIASRRLLGELTEARLGTLHYHTQPNAWFHFLSDHILTFATLPIDRTHTLVRSTWLVHAQAEEGRDYDLAALTSVWNATNAQDAHFVGETQRGASSPAYRPGPIASSEYMVGLFHTWYEERLRAELAL
ncbi:MAG TPA: aromatic ring-hydroxylating dioxygenase subunit alpha [Steroidobacteraceae bacterium]|jgi:Rieske 2Fe-2S family protein|nr:aromatic ring-hydroxylating dioxygenase subunit alpha [Steroidobacteraceae bacterium]